MKAQINKEGILLIPETPEEKILFKNMQPIPKPKRFTCNSLTVTDDLTNLQWQQAGSSTGMDFNQAHAYIQGLNDSSFGGFNDWCLPTIDELKTLISEYKNDHGLFIDPIFNTQQRYCWSVNTVKTSAGSAWSVYFFSGRVSNFDLGNYVRAVRSR